MNYSQADMLARTEALAQMLPERSDEIEQARNLPQDIAETMADIGLYRLFVPQAFGGTEAPPMDALNAMETLALQDAATAWCAMIGITSGTVIAFLPDEGARAVFAELDTRLSGVFAPMGTAAISGDNYIVNGRWQWGSGTRNAHWILAGCRVVDADGGTDNLPENTPPSIMALIPHKSVEWVDNWHTSGLCGTGSSDYIVSEVEIPQTQAMSLFSRPMIDTPLFRLPQFGLLASGIAAVALGTAQGALNECVELCASKVRSGARAPQANRQTVQFQIGEAHAKLSAARNWLHQLMQQAWAQVQDGKPSTEIRRDIRLACNLAVYTSVDVVSVAYRIAGGSAVYKTSSLQRRLRDVNVMTQHIQVAHTMYEQGGRLLMGVDTDTSLL